MHKSSPLRWAYINILLDIATPNLFSLFTGIDAPISIIQWEENDTSMLSYIVLLLQLCPNMWIWMCVEMSADLYVKYISGKVQLRHVGVERQEWKRIILKCLIQKSVIIDSIAISILYIAFYAHATGQLKIVTINRTMDCTCMCYCANSVDIDCNLDKEYGSMAISWCLWMVCNV